MQKGHHCTCTRALLECGQRRLSGGHVRAASRGWPRITQGALGEMGHVGLGPTRLTNTAFILKALLNYESPELFLFPKKAKEKELNLLALRQNGERREDEVFGVEARSAFSFAAYSVGPALLEES